MTNTPSAVTVQVLVSNMNTKLKDLAIQLTNMNRATDAVKSTIGGMAVVQQTDLFEDMEMGFYCDCGFTTGEDRPGSFAMERLSQHRRVEGHRGYYSGRYGPHTPRLKRDITPSRHLAAGWDT